MSSSAIAPAPTHLTAVDLQFVQTSAYIAQLRPSLNPPAAKWSPQARTLIQSELYPGVVFPPAARPPMPRSKINRLAHKIGRENTLQRTLHPIAPDTLKSLIHPKSPRFFRESFFASITHLEIFDIPNNLNPDDWPASTRLPHLTHLAFNSGNYLEMCLRFLSTWEALEALVFLLKENIGKKLLERYGVPQFALELRLIVIICSDYHEDRAEDFITKHKSREIDPLNYCIPEPDEDDYGQEDSEDEIDEDNGDDSEDEWVSDIELSNERLSVLLYSSEPPSESSLVNGRNEVRGRASLRRQIGECRTCMVQGVICPEFTGFEHILRANHAKLFSIPQLYFNIALKQFLFLVTWGDISKSSGKHRKYGLAKLLPFGQRGKRTEWRPPDSTGIMVFGSGGRHQPMPPSADEPVATSALITGRRRFTPSVLLRKIA
ncbi:hypothetical protein B0H14DRAFT_2590947 [Mycena olivaceomarginata]|nr:hypothetical protein B0H14DRAFT_2590947 [Mycena olivaceomarginata]